MDAMRIDTLTLAAYARLREDIVSGKVGPSTLLSERDLADTIGISRTPLRQALFRLENEGLIERLANGALLVRAVTVEKLLEILRLRQVLESAAAARAAEFGMTPDLRAAREGALRFIDRPADFEGFWLEDERFHIAVATAARLVLLPGILAEQRAIVRRSTIIRTHARFDEQAREHLAVIDAIEAQDPEAARRAMAHHFEAMQSRSLGMLSDPGERQPDAR
jgi:DNA-binding GntR family transcriptional regulator